MLATLFEKTTPISYVNAGFVLLFVSIFRYSTQYGQGFDIAIAGQQALESSLVYLAMLTSSLYFRASGFLKENHYYPPVFFLIYAFVPKQVFSPSTWLSLGVLFWIATLFVKTPWKKEPQKMLMDMAFFMTLLGVLNPILIFLFPLYLSALYLSDIKKIQFYLIPVVVFFFASFTILTIHKLYPILPEEFFLKGRPSSTLAKAQNGTLETLAWYVGVGFGFLWLLWQLLLGRQFNKYQKNTLNFQVACYSFNLILLFLFQAAQFNSVFFLPLLAFVFTAAFLHKANRFKGNIYFLVLLSGIVLKAILFVTDFRTGDLLEDPHSLWPF